jgi:ring-1,2-phenylacetyl-CoA epoxidase subunit PaaD
MQVGSFELDKPSSATVQQVWGWLSEIPDPEIPVISLVDLGIIRDVTLCDGEIIVVITPTYTGCPATAVIQLEIQNELTRRGLKAFRLTTQLSPAWSSSWISDAGRQKLLDYGIVPPERSSTGCASVSEAAAIQCPRCKSSNTARVSQFGSTPCKALYKCEDCLEPFDYFKCI